MLHEFIQVNRDEIIRRCRAKVAVRSIPPPTAAEIDHGVPLFLDQLGRALRLETCGAADIKAGAAQHGHDLRDQGLTVSQVVHDYGDICQAITELAVETHAPMTTDEFRLLNRCLDDAIAGAVTQYGREQAQSLLEAESARGHERAGFLAHELRNHVQTAVFAFDALRKGRVGIGGSTASVLDRSLSGLREIVDRSIAEIRFDRTASRREVVLLSAFLDEIAPAAMLEARTRGITLVVTPVESGLAIEVDRRAMTSVLVNLLQNAAKFTRAHTAVTLRVRASSERVLIEVQDECGGLPTGDVEDLFRPFEQRGADRSGMGLGLAFTRTTVEADLGRVYARNLPGEGCVFTVDLPRSAVTVTR